MSSVNLDALIPREDFLVAGDDQKTNNLTDTITLRDLEKGQSFFYSSLRKPDFQRETSDWKKEKVKDFIKSFLEGDLIPSIILWNSGQYTFVIDGAHRLSALIAWVNDDYGDGFISQSFFNHAVEEEQKQVAEQARRLVNKDVLSYANYRSAIMSPEQAGADILATAQKLGFLSLQVQWVKGPPEKAEQSFFTINQKATPISDTELSLLKSRRKPQAMASRAIVRSGRGHKYWAKFSDEIKSEIENLSLEVNSAMFSPTVKNPIKTLDLPLAGKGYSTRSLPLVFDLVRLANNYIGSNSTVDDDVDGSLTVKFLKRTNKIIRRMTTTHASSLGLHPAVYFYSEKGRYQPTAFLAWVDLIKEFEVEREYENFTKNRKVFEEFLVMNKHITNQVTVKYGSSLKGFRQLKDVYRFMYDAIKRKEDYDSLIGLLSNEYSYLNMDYRGDRTSKPDFSRDTKSEVFLTSALEGASRCALCGGYAHVNSMHIDHIHRKQDGGLGVADNGQLSHPYCNTTFKN
ncbi:MAG: hypothetical protein CMO05_10180 [Thalassospira sp.]|uniref:HNH endonuclease family protein n=1 Tax=Thalassospira sp. GB04J01 TaxID=1485225 RepID=UPI000C108022|nr:DUF262 domain-containing protein [Thalassospira sp. GB04J01]MBV17823.1 hypothetical protein [Thalassospira sp.]